MKIILVSGANRAICLAALFLLAARAWAQTNTSQPPADWIDPDTGHRIIRLSTEPGSSTLYFHDNSYTPEGDKLIFNTPSGVAVMDITKLGEPAAEVRDRHQRGRREHGAPNAGGLCHAAAAARRRTRLQGRWHE